jgi:hypothetical protein
MYFIEVAKSELQDVQICFFHVDCSALFFLQGA